MSLASGAAFLVVLWELNFESPFCWIYNHHLKWLWVFYILCFPWCLDQFVQSLAFPLTSVDVYVHIICRLSKYSRLSGWLTTFFVDSRNFAALMFPSLLVITSTILPDFHEPLGKSSLSCTMSPICDVSFASILGDFNFSVDLSRRLNR